MPFLNRIFLLAGFFLSALAAKSQDTPEPRDDHPVDTTHSRPHITADTAAPHHNTTDTTAPHHAHWFTGREQVDLIDIGRSLFLRHGGVRMDSSGKKAGKYYPAVLPSAEYTLETGLAFDLTEIGRAHV